MELLSRYVLEKGMYIDWSASIKLCEPETVDNAFASVVNRVLKLTGDGENSMA